MVVFRGTSGNDTLGGHSSTINNSGNDTFYGYAGWDWLYGGGWK